MKCQSEFYAGLGEIEMCGKPAVALVDAGTKHEYLVCQQCADRCHPSRITFIDLGSKTAPIDFWHLSDGTIKITQDQSQITFPESELIRLFGWYFELEDHNAVLELVERVDK